MKSEKKPVWKGAFLCDSNYMTPGKGKTMEILMDPWLTGGRDKQAEYRKFLGYRCCNVDYYTFVKPCRMYNTNTKHDAWCKLQILGDNVLL